MNQTTDTKNIIDLSGAAVDELIRLDVNREEFLRIALVDGGCSGLTYQLNTDTVQTPFDSVLFENNDLKVISDRNSAEHLDGLYIDYSNDLIDVGFKFSNPNAVSTCGCGNSMKV
ncbi:MAG: iron-sulfur cluster assembly accessory protein [Bacteroidetes bacterium]|nr:iron-sulfur cluster assembly accessory protein [Bacteroidota bacterium]